MIICVYRVIAVRIWGLETKVVSRSGVREGLICISRKPGATYKSLLVTTVPKNPRLLMPNSCCMNAGFSVNVHISSTCGYFGI